MIKIIITDKQEKKINKWIKEHEKECKEIQKHKKITEKGFVPYWGWGDISIEIIYDEYKPRAWVSCICGESECIGEFEYYKDTEGVTFYGKDI